MHVCAEIYEGTNRGQKRVLDTLGLELQNGSSALREHDYSPLITEPSLQLHEYKL